MRRKVGIETVAYSYHFQNKENQLLFRYDNAKPKPALGFAPHKHCVNSSVIDTSVPHLQQVIEESVIMQQLI